MNLTQWARARVAVKTQWAHERVALLDGKEKEDSISRWKPEGTTRAMSATESR